MNFLLRVTRAKFVLDKARRWMWKERGTTTVNRKYRCTTVHGTSYVKWALIASRINNILGLDLDFYSVQQTLSSGGTVAAIKARCHKEVDRIDKQFDDCMAFLLRVSIHPCIRLFLLGTVDSILSVF
ncbi:putative gamma-tubulin complex component protein [Helianthus annuus]|uniref:Gamma-tubulin complex component protein n=1 Tax=Helianthus annuus TaxID=4232 RepID=A0A9K3N9R8_HELAN|nr:putative gamma-tubulin complex component protein [Helianthus annuus]KAJ0535224.1 putative gamma-tubulin complex component protein [Helianthus annuus]KAJ0712111.1 putative gamma-tubulin complex component protein [Helianthus annuus]KAJ0889096.1 putative gamma-tubulin complex component protein [Helianthus annuus]KAJ0893923.1 putative gamma-tubulin complex component protein [Helianthus annuus]